MSNRITIWLTCFCASAISAVFWPSLPSQMSMAVLLAIIVILSAILICKTRCNYLSGYLHRLALPYLIAHGVLAGVLWLASVGHLHYAWQLPTSKIQQDVTIFARVLSGGCILNTNGKANALSAEHKTHAYTVELIRIERQSPIQFIFGGKAPYTVEQFTTPRARLTQSFITYDGDAHTIDTVKCLQDNDVFSARVKLKPAYGVLNPVGFNQQQMLASQNIHFTGYIKKGSVEVVISSPSIRRTLASALVSLELVNTKWWLALLLGIRNELLPEDWTMLQHTGTGHLFSISGMHLGVIAASTFLLCHVAVFLLKWLHTTITNLLRRSIDVGELNLTSHLIATEKANKVSHVVAPIRVVVIFIVLLCAFGYTCLSGMSLPVVRAFVLVCIVAAFSTFKWSVRPVHVGLVMVAMSIVLFPLSILSASFYLSIFAVLVIWYVVVRFNLSAKPRYVAAFQLQFILSIVMVPFTVLWFESASIISIVANLVAVPVITCLLPLCLLALIAVAVTQYTHPSIIHLAQQILLYADQCLSYLLELLRWLSAQHFAFVNVTFSTPQAWCCVLLTAIVLAPHFRFKTVYIVVLAISLLSRFFPTHPSMWQLHVLDAGQASAIVITKGNRAVVIDSGASFNGNARTAENVLLPLLDQYNINAIDHVVHTHSDNDHAGGQQVIERSLVARNAIYYSPRTGCERGKVIYWQSLTIRFLWPLPGNQEDSNAQSCVVRISDNRNHVLIAGDIERASEYALLTLQKASKTLPLLKANVLVAPHHGSNTSSTDVFIKAVSPNVVIFTQGYENRWAFPDENVVKRYRDNDVSQYLTSTHGYINVEFDSRDSALCQSKSDNVHCVSRWTIETQRMHRQKRWYLPAYHPSHLSLLSLKSD